MHLFWPDIKAENGRLFKSGKAKAKASCTGFGRETILHALLGAMDIENGHRVLLQTQLLPLAQDVVAVLPRAFRYENMAKQC